MPHSGAPSTRPRSRWAADNEEEEDALEDPEREETERTRRHDRERREQRSAALERRYGRQ